MKRPEIGGIASPDFDCWAGDTTVILSTNQRLTALLPLLGLIAVAFCLGWTSSRLWLRPQGMQARELALGAPVVLVDGRRWVVVEEHYPDGALAWRSAVLERPGHDGSYSMGPYDYHGVRTAYHPNGVTSEVGTHIAGIKHGVWRRWDEQGGLIAEEVWRQGQRIKPAN